MDEVWKQIPEFPAYDVSNLGRVRSYYRRWPGGPGNNWYVSDSPARVLKPGTDNGKNPNVGLRRNGMHTQAHVANLVMRTFIGPTPKGMKLFHRDRDTGNNTIGNLFYAKKRHRAGTAERVRKMRFQRATGIPLEQLSAEHNLVPGYVSDICSGRRFSDVGGPIEALRRPKFSPDEIVDMRNLRVVGHTLARLALLYGCHESTVSRICTGSLYAKIDGPLISARV